MMSHYTLDTSPKDIVSVLIIQGVAFACLFIPLTTVALAGIPRNKLADATGLNSLLRQIGGSLGLAVFATLIPHYTADAEASIGAHINQANPLAEQRINMLTRAFESRGYDHAAALDAAERALQGLVAQQSSVLLFEKLFLLAGILFLFVLPLLIFLKSPDHGEVVKVDTHLEV
jgi:DHA2 family multidrug resistance protein